MESSSRRSPGMSNPGTRPGAHRTSDSGRTSPSRDPAGVQSEWLNMTGHLRRKSDHKSLFHPNHYAEETVCRLENNILHVSPVDIKSPAMQIDLGMYRVFPSDKKLDRFKLQPLAPPSEQSTQPVIALQGDAPKIAQRWIRAIIASQEVHIATEKLRGEHESDLEQNRQRYNKLVGTLAEAHAEVEFLKGQMKHVDDLKALMKQNSAGGTASTDDGAAVEMQRAIEDLKQVLREEGEQKFQLQEALAVLQEREDERFVEKQESIRAGDGESEQAIIDLQKKVAALKKDLAAEQQKVTEAEEQARLALAKERARNHEADANTNTLMVPDEAARHEVVTLRARLHSGHVSDQCLIRDCLRTLSLVKGMRVGKPLRRILDSKWDSEESPAELPSSQAQQGLELNLFDPGAEEPASGSPQDSSSKLILQDSYQDSTAQFQPPPSAITRPAWIPGAPVRRSAFEIMQATVVLTRTQDWAPPPQQDKAAMRCIETQKSAAIELKAYRSHAAVQDENENTLQDLKKLGPPQIKDSTYGSVQDEGKSTFQRLKRRISPQMNDSMTQTACSMDTQTLETSQDMTCQTERGGVEDVAQEEQQQLLLTLLRQQVQQQEQQLRLQLQLKQQQEEHHILYLQQLETRLQQERDVTHKQYQQQYQLQMDETQKAAEQQLERMQQQLDVVRRQHQQQLDERTKVTEREMRETQMKQQREMQSKYQQQLEVLEKEAKRILDEEQQRQREEYQKEFRKQLQEEREELLRRQGSGKEGEEGARTWGVGEGQQHKKTTAESSGGDEASASDDGSAPSDASVGSAAFNPDAFPMTRSESDLLQELASRFGASKFSKGSRVHSPLNAEASRTQSVPVHFRKGRMNGPGQDAGHLDRSKSSPVQCPDKPAAQPPPLALKPTTTAPYQSPNPPDTPVQTSSDDGDHISALFEPSPQKRNLPVHGAPGPPAEAPTNHPPATSGWAAFPLPAASQAAPHDAAASSGWAAFPSAVPEAPTHDAAASSGWTAFPAAAAPDAATKDAAAAPDAATKDAAAAPDAATKEAAASSGWTAFGAGHDDGSDHDDEDDDKGFESPSEGEGVGPKPSGRGWLDSAFEKDGFGFVFGQGNQGFGVDTNMSFGVPDIDRVDSFDSPDDVKGADWDPFEHNNRGIPLYDAGSSPAWEPGPTPPLHSTSTSLGQASIPAMLRGPAAARHQGSGISDLSGNGAFSPKDSRPQRNFKYL